MMRNLPGEWHLEADIVSIGSGVGGLSAAITAHAHGASAIVLERAGQVGGVTALSMGQVWVAGNHLAEASGIDDSARSGYRYLRHVSMGYGDDAAILNLTIHARLALKYFEDQIGLHMMVIRNCPDYYYGICADTVAEGRLLEVMPFPAQSLGEWQTRTRTSYVPYGLTHADMFSRGGVANMAKWDFDLMSERLAKDERCLGPGLAACFVKGALDRRIPMHTGVNVQELIGDGVRIVGVRATRDGRDLFVKARRGVLIAVGGYERNAGYSRTLGLQLDPESVVPPAIDGANLRLAGPLGARIARVPDVTLLGIHVPGEELEEGVPLWRVVNSAMGLPHTIVVNRQGRRFANEAQYRAIGYALDFIDGGTQTHPNFPCWAIFDSQAREKYPFGSVTPGQDLPAALGVTADSIAELAGRIGVDAQGLVATITTFNRHAGKGEDPEFHRGTHPWSTWFCGDPFHEPHPNLGALVKPPFHAVELHRMAGTGIPAAGLLTDHQSRVMGWDEKPIEGLYAAGNSVARMETGAAMQSGVSNARGMTHGYLAARHALGKPSDLLEQEIARLGL